MILSIIIVLYTNSCRLVGKAVLYVKPGFPRRRRDFDSHKSLFFSPIVIKMTTRVSCYKNKQELRRRRKILLLKMIVLKNVTLTIRV